jgi:fatty-acid desaturase
MVKLSKVTATINIFISLVVLFTCYIHLRNHFEIYKPKDMGFGAYFQTIISLISYALISITVSILFLIKKKLGWWSIVIVTIIITIRSIYIVTCQLIYTPSHYNLKTEILLALFYTLSSIVYLSTPVRKYFKISKNPD